ncbi:MAG: hypothetical protein AAGF11_23220 [Myxococcota bacterium]
MQSAVSVLGPIIPLSSGDTNSDEEPSMLPLTREEGPSPTASGLFDICTLASLEAPRTVVEPFVSAELYDDPEMPRFAGSSLSDMPIVAALDPIKSEAPAVVEAATDPMRSVLVTIVAVLSAVFVGMLPFAV